MKKLKHTIAFLSIIFVAACNDSKAEEANTSIGDIKIIQELTHKWNECVVNQDMKTLTTIYAEQVSLYGTSVSNTRAISNKEAFYKKYSDFKQSIPQEIIVTQVTENQYKATFLKRSTFGGKTIEVEGYLLFDKMGGNWKITNESDALTDNNNSRKKENNSNEPIFGQTISGDFDGNGVKEMAVSVRAEEGTGIPGDGGTSDEFAVSFSDDRLGSLPLSCCDFFMVNEGDLNNNGSDEFTVFQSAENGCTKYVRTFTYSVGGWKELYEPFMYSIGCGVEITEEEFLMWVTLEQGSIYYREPDPNDQNLLNLKGDRINFNRLLKTKAKLK